MSANNASGSSRLTFVLMGVSFGLVILSTLWLSFVGIKISTAGNQIASPKLEIPTFEQYRKAFRLEELIAPKPAGVDSRAIARGAPSEQIFDWISEFENDRSGDRLRKIRPVLTGVVTTSLADRVGLRSADELVSVNGREVASVLAVYDALNQPGEQAFRLVIRRKGTLFSTNIAAPAGERLDAESVGLLFDVPKGLNVLGRTQVRALSNQFEAQFLLAIAPQWRRQYLDNLGSFAHELLALVDSQKTLTEGQPGFIRVDQMIGWHHDAFTGSVDRISAQARQASIEQLAALGSFGDAVIGLIASLVLFFGAFWAHNKARLVGSED